MGGLTPNPIYHEVCTGCTGHAETVRVTYDPTQVSTEAILTIFLENHDPTQGMRQGNDVGTQYRSAFYTEGPNAAEEKQTVDKLVNAYGKKLQANGYGEVTTEIATLAETPAGEYYLAEDEHQQYLEKNPQGYCPHHGTGIACSI